MGYWAWTGLSLIVIRTSDLTKPVFTRNAQLKSKCRNKGKLKRSLQKVLNVLLKIKSKKYTLCKGNLTTVFTTAKVYIEIVFLSFVFLALLVYSVVQNLENNCYLQQRPKDTVALSPSSLLFPQPRCCQRLQTGLDSKRIYRSLDEKSTTETHRSKQVGKTTTCSEVCLGKTQS